VILKEAIGKRLLFPLPGGPATTTILGRGKLTAEVGSSVLAHLFGEFALQEPAFLVNDSATHSLPTLRLVDPVTIGQDLGHEGIQRRVIVDVDRIKR
jgi:hypothetical protein